MLSLGLYPGPYLSLEKEKENFFVLFTFSIKWAHEVRYFHVVVVQWWQRIVQKNMMHMQSYCFANINLLVFPIHIAFAVPIVIAY